MNIIQTLAHLSTLIGDSIISFVLIINILSEMVVALVMEGNRTNVIIVF